MSTYFHRSLLVRTAIRSSSSDHNFNSSFLKKYFYYINDFQIFKLNDFKIIIHDLYY